MHMVKNAVTEERIRGVLIPGERKQHCISQYAGDSSIMIRGVKKNIDEIVRTLKIFSEALGIE